MSIAENELRIIIINDSELIEHPLAKVCKTAASLSFITLMDSDSVAVNMLWQYGMMISEAKNKMFSFDIKYKQRLSVSLVQAWEAKMLVLVEHPDCCHSKHM